MDTAITVRQRSGLTFPATLEELKPVLSTNDLKLTPHDRPTRASKQVDDTTKLGQVRPSAVLHFPQNFVPAGFSNSHFEQRIGGLPNFRRQMREYRRNTGQRKQPREKHKTTKGGPENTSNFAFANRLASVRT
jgi:hypothetical protein